MAYLKYWIHKKFIQVRKTNVTIIASPKMPKKYVLEYEGKKIPSIVIKKIYMMETLSETEFAPSTIENSFFPNVFIDITKYMEKKIKIMRLYKSEIKNHTGNVSKDNEWFVYDEEEGEVEDPYEEYGKRGYTPDDIVRVLQRCKCQAQLIDINENMFFTSTLTREEIVKRKVTILLWHGI